MKKQKDVKHNTVYYANWSGTLYLVLYDENRIGKDHYIRITDASFGSNASFSSHSHFLKYLIDPGPGISMREATSIEDRWLRQCIEEGKYIDCPKEEVINHYAIY